MKSARLIHLILVAALVTSVAVNLKLYQLCSRFHTREATVRLNPVGTPTHHHPPPSAASRTLVIVGDSRANHWSDSPCDDIRFINHGVGNETTAQILLRTDQALAVSDADAFLIVAGINDLKTIPLMPEHRSRITRNCISNLRSIATRLAQSGKPVLISTVFPCGNVPLTRRPWWSPEVDAAIQEVNQAIHAMDGEPGIRVFDSHQILSNPAGMVQEDYQADLLHLNTLGYQVLNRALTQHLSTRK